MTKEESNILIAKTTRWIVGIGSLVFAIFIFWLLVHFKPEPASTGEQKNAPSIQVIETVTRPIQRQYTGYGVAEALNAADVPARVNATVIDIPKGIDPGNNVGKGQILAMLDDSDFLRQVEIAEKLMVEAKTQMQLLDVEKQRLKERLELEQEDVELAEIDLQRTITLNEKGVGNPQDTDRAKRDVIRAKTAALNTQEMIDKLSPRELQLNAQIARLESSLTLAKLNLERCTITSPLDGILQYVDVEVGENLAPGQRVARVVDLSRMEISVQLPSSARADLTVGDEVQLQSTNRKITWESTIARIAPENNTSTRTLTVYVEVDQKQAVEKFGRSSENTLLAPGQYLYANITSSRITPGVVIPRRAVREGRIFVVINGVIHSREVNIVYSMQDRSSSKPLHDDQWVVLEAGALADGTQVVVNGSSSILDGDTVQPITASQADATKNDNPVKEVSP